MSLLKHCADGNLAEIKAILRQRKGRRDKVEVRDNHNWTCLHHAVKNGNLECIEFLLTIKELDTTAETFEGETALHIALTIPNITLEIVSALIEANPDLVNFVDNEEIDLLKIAIIRDRLDIVKLLIANGAPVNKSDLDGDTALHIAAIEIKLDAIRYLLYETECDVTIRNDGGRTACVLLFAKLLAKVIGDEQEHVSLLSLDEIDCFEELTRFTYNSCDINNLNENELDLNEMINLGYRYDHPRSCLYERILNLFYVPPSKQYFFRKIKQSKVPSCHCLIIALLVHSNTENFYKELWPKFLLELFMFFLEDESFFQEYISEIMSSGIICLDAVQLPDFNAFIVQRKDSVEPQKLFTFFKTLILYEFDFDILLSYYGILMMPSVILHVFVSLAKLMMPSYLLENSSTFNSNFDEFDRLIEPEIDENQEKNDVVSLKNLCRMSIRRFYFQNYSHYTALKTLYSLKLPVQIRNFLCYNFGNFKF